MAKKLDRKREFGEIMGHEGGACFIQDEILFDAEGNELVTKAAPAPKAPVAKKVAAPAPAPADDQLAAQLDGGASDFAA